MSQSTPESDDDDVIFMGLPPEVQNPTADEKRRTPKSSASSKINVLQRKKKPKVEGKSSTSTKIRSSSERSGNVTPRSNVLSAAGSSPTTVAEDNGNLVCCASNCRNTPLAHSRMMFYSFPPNSELREKWVAAARAADPKFTLSPQSILCDVHFKRSDFTREMGVKILNGGAVPSIFVPPSHEGELVCCVEGCGAVMDGKSSTTFHRFPVNEERRKQWMIAANLKTPPVDTTVVCSAHFLPKFLKTGHFGVVSLEDNAIPTVFPKHLVFLKPPSSSESPLTGDSKKNSSLKSGDRLYYKIAKVNLNPKEKERADKQLEEMNDEEYKNLVSTIPVEESPDSTAEQQTNDQEKCELPKMTILTTSRVPDAIDEPPEKKIKKERPLGVPVIKLDLPSLIPQLTTVKTKSTDPSQPAKHLAILPLSQLKKMPGFGFLPARLPAPLNVPAASKQTQGPFKLAKIPIPGHEGMISKAVAENTANDPDHSYSSTPALPEPSPPQPGPSQSQLREPVRTNGLKPIKCSGSDDDSGDSSPSPPSSPINKGLVGPNFGIERVDYLRKIYKTKLDHCKRKLKSATAAKRRLIAKLQAVSLKLDQAELNSSSKDGSLLNHRRKPLEQVLIVDTVPSCPCRRKERLRMALLPTSREDLGSIMKEAVDAFVPDHEESVEMVSENEKLLRRITNIKQGLRNKDIVRCIVIQAEDIESLPS